MHRTPAPLMTDAAARARFLEVLADTGNATAAAAQLGISRSTVYRARLAFPDFAAGFDAAGGPQRSPEARRALSDARKIARIEAALIDRALHGVEKIVRYGGEELARDRQFSDSLAMFVLRNRLPDVYGNHRTINVTPVPTAPSPLPSRGELFAKIDAALERFPPHDDPDDAPDVN